MSSWKAAVGEVLLIVVGILIAMAAQDWQNARTARRAEVAALRELRAALSGDLAVLDSTLARHERIASQVSALLSVLRSGRPYADSLDAYFGAVYGFQTLELNRAGYESLKSRGLDLVSDDALRSRIADVYERVYPHAQQTAELEEDVVLGLLRPYFLLHFRDLRFGGSATPMNYAALLVDPNFMNLVDYRLQTVQQNHIVRLREATTAIRGLLDSIDAELSSP